ncbi:MAG: bacillithiol biosynthesis BshC [Planctomycetes bacterium]|nr:bacillithiol biosynthesis BshC [Planctomycetota bacterium]
MVAPPTPRCPVSLPGLPVGAACVVTGQQVGVLTGPLLTLLKAARAISFAREQTAERGAPVVPLFWAASDDHDLDEIHHTFVVNGQDEVQRLRLELGPDRGAASEVVVPIEAGRALVAELFTLAAIDPAAFPLEPWLPQPGDTLASWFIRCFRQLFGAHAPAVIEPRELTAAARPLFDQALRDDGAIGRALAEGAAANAAAGLAAPLPVEDEPPLFVIERGARTRVRRGARPGEFLVGERTISRAALLDLAGPGLPRLSANVALRTIVQAGCLPALAYVAGPTELLYYRQLEPLHRLFGVPFPQLVRRPHATLLTTAAARAARKLGLAPDRLLAALAAREAGPPARSPLLERGAALRHEVAGYVEQLLALSPAVKSAADRRATQLLQSFDGLLERAASAVADGEQSETARWKTLAATLRPRGKPQDRSLNGLPFLAQRGPALIEALLELRGEPDQHGVVPHPVL